MTFCPCGFVILHARTGEELLHFFVVGTINVAPFPRTIPIPFFSPRARACVAPAMSETSDTPTSRQPPPPVSPPDPVMTTFVARIPDVLSSFYDHAA